jgi:glycosyltransferase involved in cell wall biosynthesis
MSPGDEYLLHVGVDCWYKNRPGVLSITAELRKWPLFRGVKLVLAGAPLPPDLREKAEALGGVVEVPGPSDERLRALYTGAQALLFPSFEEGFGWPILEAQACGCAVITSERSPMMDVAGGAAILIDPEDAGSAATVIAKRAGELDTLRRAGLANVRGYSMDNTMHRYCRVYEELVSASPGKRGDSGNLQATV